MTRIPFLLFAAALLASPAVFANEKAPAAAGTAGASGTPATLPTDKLRSDTLAALVPQGMAAGGGKAQDMRAYVVAQPEGEVGARVWHEHWVVSCDTGEFAADIRFNESGMDAADYRIRLVR